MYLMRFRNEEKGELYRVFPPVILVDRSVAPGENHRPVTSHWQTLSHNIVSDTPRHERDSELTTLVTNCLGSCKYKYHTVTTITAFIIILHRHISSYVGKNKLFRTLLFLFFRMYWRSRNHSKRTGCCGLRWNNQDKRKHNVKLD